MIDITGAIFDMDGTLLESMTMWKYVGEYYLKLRNLEPNDETRYATMFMDTWEAAELFIRTYGIDEPLEKVDKEINDLVYNFYETQASAKKGVPEMLEALKNRGVKMCVATYTDRLQSIRGLERTGLIKYFSEVFSCLDYNTHKDTPKIFDIARKHLGTAKETTWIFEDSWYAINTVKNAGYPVIALEDFHSEARRDLIKAKADYYFESAEDVLSIL